MNAAPANVFCASSLFHLLVLQPLARSRREQGERNLLVLTRPLRGEPEQHLSGFAPYRRLLLEDLWDGLLADERVARDYDLGPGGEGWRAPLRAARAQRRLDRFLASAGALGAVYVCNTFTSAVELHVAAWGRARGAALNLVEDGIGSYLPSSLKRSIDSSYWGEEGRGSLRRAGDRLLGLDRRSLGAPSPGAALDYDATHVLFPDRFPGTRANGEIVALPPSGVRDTIASLHARVEREEPPRPGVPRRIYLSRPDSEDGLISMEDEVELVASALQRLSGSGPVALKPHPRDLRAKIDAIAARSGVEVVDPDPHPAELFLDLHRPPSCHGTWSGSLVYAQMLLGIPAASELPGFCAALQARRRASPALEEILAALGDLFPEVFAAVAAPPGGRA